MTTPPPLSGTGTNCTASPYQPKVKVSTNSSGAISSVIPVYSGYNCAGAISFTISGLGSGTGGAVTTIAVGPNNTNTFPGGAIGTWFTDYDTVGGFLYDNSGQPGNPLNSIFTNGNGGVYDPGLPVTPFGEVYGVQISG